jgi:cell division control protein 6
MGVFSNQESVFKNEDALDAEWLPKNLPYREAQHHQIAHMISPLLQGRNGRNCIISGSPGIGKTAAVKLVLKELEEHPDVNAPDVHVLYVNCWQKNSTYKIFVDFCEQLGYKFTQNKNTEDLFKIILNIVNKSAVVFAFDEVDKVSDVDFLYDILTEVFKKTIIMITNHPEWYNHVDERVRSRLLPEKIDFKKYSKEEILGILKHRVDFAFVQGAWDQDAMSLIADRAFQSGDVRVGLHLLRESGFAAEDSLSKKISDAHVKKALEKMDGFSIKPEDDLGDDAKAILALIKNQEELKIGDLFKLYQEKDPEANYKTFQRRIERLAQGGFVDTKKVVGGKEGTTTMVSWKNNSL